MNVSQTPLNLKNHTDHNSVDNVPIQPFSVNVPGKHPKQLMDLNEYCLEHVLWYLPVEDMIRATKVCTLWKRIVKERLYPAERFCVSEFFLKKYQDVFEDIAHAATKMIIMNLPQPEITRVLSMTNKLISIEFQDVTLDVDPGFIHYFPSQLEELFFMNCRMTPLLLKILLTNIKVTLRSISISGYLEEEYYGAILELHNLKQFCFEYNSPSGNEFMNKLVEQNSQKLEVYYVSCYSKTAHISLDDKFWKTMNMCKNMKRIGLVNYELKTLPPKDFHLPLLWRLQLNEYNDGFDEGYSLNLLLNELAKKHAASLTSLVLLEFDFIPNLKKFVNLDDFEWSSSCCELHVPTTSEIRGLLKKLYPLKTLKSVNMDLMLETRDIINLVKNLPKLENLYFVNMIKLMSILGVIDPDRKKLKRLLESQKRILYVNNELYH